MDKNKTWYQLLLFLILIAGAVLRFWDYFNLPFTFDEMSAMSRTTYDSFSDLIKYGVIERDTHPAGVQVFMYYWVMWFGEAEWVVKLPFVIAGLFSIWLVYKVAALWFGNTTAVLTAAYMSSLQLFVMYSQMARPYASGLFLTAAMVFFWSRYLLGKGKLIDLVLFVLFAALSSYNHHFSLLFASITGISGLFFIRKDQRIPYVLSGLAIFILYVPHLGVFFAQLEKGGIGGWLTAPDIGFPIRFFWWLFHYSAWVVVLFSAVVVFGLVSGSSKKVKNLVFKKRLTAILWFFLPLIIGYVYSLVREPIIQYSLLIFSTPYLFMFIFSFLKEIEIKKMSILVVLILIVNILTLVLKRDYYKIFYRQGFEQVVVKAIELQESYPDQVFIINNYIPYYAEYYFRKYNTSIPYFSVRNKNLGKLQFKEVVQSIEEDVVITSAISDSYYKIIKEQFPYHIETDRGFTFEHDVFSKYGPDSLKQLLPDTLAKLAFNKPGQNWGLKLKHIKYDSALMSSVYFMDKNVKYGPTIEFPLDEITEYGYTFIDIEATIIPFSQSANGVLVTEIKRGDEPVSWFGQNFYEYGLKKNKGVKVYSTIYLHDAMKTSTDIRNCKLKFYVWNPQQEQFYIEDILITTRPGNPYRYALFYDFKSND